MREDIGLDRMLGRIASMFGNFILSQDSYAAPIQINLRGKDVQQTYPGGIISLIATVAAIVLGYFSFIGMV